MSIHNLFNKIKGKWGIDRLTIMYLCIIIGVGFSSFGLGRLSVQSSEPASISDTTQSLIQQQSLSSNNKEASYISTPEVTKNKNYVASKNGKLYYTAGCSLAKRISTKNEIWFATANDAEKYGYKPSSSCK